MHRLEQLARAAQIELTDGGAGVRLNGEDITGLIRTQQISDAASKVSAVPAVRRALVEKQREMGETHSVVMEGRDIGTNVFPNAQVKIFLDASVDVRAARRLKDLEAKGVSSTLAKVAAEIRERDERDSTRSEAPLRQADDAVYIDSSHLSPEEVEEAVLKVYRDRTSNGKAHGGTLQ
jgi:CMP/dCMP kinase